MIYIDRHGSKIESIIPPKFRKSVHVMLHDYDRIIFINPTYASNVLELPGGGLEDGESALDGLQRECFEEIGLNIDFDKDYIQDSYTQVVNFYADDCDEYWEYHNTFYLYPYGNFLVNYKSPENHEVSWITKKELERHTVNYLHQKAVSQFLKHTTVYAPVANVQFFGL
jgi:8-oxo-dGTP pyrophosphatase MutT (NUDIX family)